MGLPKARSTFYSTRVRSLVFSQVARRLEGLRAASDVALVRFVARVRSLVRLHAVRRREGALAVRKRADERLFAAVNSLVSLRMGDDRIFGTFARSNRFTLR